MLKFLLFGLLALLLVGLVFAQISLSREKVFYRFENVKGEPVSMRQVIEGVNDLKFSGNNSIVRSDFVVSSFKDGDLNGGKNRSG